MSKFAVEIGELLGGRDRAAINLFKTLRRLGFESVEQLRPLISIREDLGISNHRLEDASTFRRLLKALDDQK